MGEAEFDKDEIVGKLSDAELLEILAERLKASGPANPDILNQLTSITNDYKSRVAAQQGKADTITTTIEPPSTEPPIETPAVDPNLTRLREILSVQELPYYINVQLSPGTHFRGQVAERRGAYAFTHEGARNRPYITSGRFGLGNHPMHTVLDMSDSEYPKGPGAALFLPNIDSSGETTILFAYPRKPEGISDRGGTNFMGIVLPDAKADEVNSILRQSDFIKALTIIQDAIDPELNEVSTIPSMKGLKMASIPGCVNGLFPPGMALTSAVEKVTTLIPAKKLSNTNL